MIALGSIHTTLSSHDSGPGTITGTVKNTPSTPVYRRVRLHEQSSGRFVRETWSDSITGAYSFPGLRLTHYYIVGFDHSGTFSGVIATDVLPEL